MAQQGLSSVLSTLRLWRGARLVALQSVAAAIVGCCAIALQCPPQATHELVSPSHQPDDAFGLGVALSERYLAVVDPADSRVSWLGGAVFIYERPTDRGGAWTLSDELRIDNADPGVLAGSCLDIDGDTIALGVPSDSTAALGAGAVYVFERGSGPDGRWKLAAQLLPPEPTVDESFGRSVALDGQLLVVGAPLARRSGQPVGSAFVFTRASTSANGWTESQKLMPDAAQYGASFGDSVDIEADTIAVGAWAQFVGGVNAGAVFMFESRGGPWTLTRTLSAPVPTNGDQFGSPLALNDGLLAVGAIGDDDLGSDAGAVHLFDRAGMDWVHSAKLHAIGGASNDYFGTKLALDDGVVVVGCHFVDSSVFDSGAVYVFSQDTSAREWVQRGRLAPSDLTFQDQFGFVDIANRVIAAGTPGFTHPGSVHLYSWRDERSVATYCRPSPSPLPDCQPEISFLGAPSASGNATFELRSGRLPGEQFGMLLYSHSPAAPSPLEAAGLCLPQGSVLRSGVLWSGGTLGQCNGGFVLDWNEFVQQSASAAPLLEVPGTLVRGQFAYFPLLGSGPSGLSDAVIFTICH